MTARIISIMSGRIGLGGASTDPATSLGSDAPSDSVFLTTSSPFERGEVIQTLFDVGAVLFAFLFVSLTALAIVGSVGLLFFAL
jgi:hypothetical protein